MPETSLERPAEGDRQLAAVAYLLTWLTGLLVLVLADEDQRYARWHAIQAIGLGVLAVLTLSVLGVIQLLVRLVGFLGGGAAVDLSFPVLPFPMIFGWGGLSGIGNLLVLALAIVFAITAYRGDTIRIPVLADLADDHA